MLCSPLFLDCQGDILNNLPYYSYSKIKAFNDCPYAFFERYYDDINKDFLESNGVSEFGTFMHKILEMYAKKELKREDVLNYYIDNFSIDVTSSFILKFEKGFKRNMFDTYYNSGKEYLETFDGFKGLKILDVEYEFKENIQNVFILNGKIDLVAENNKDELLLIDHKSKNGFKKQEKEEYSKQLYLYAHALKQKYGKYPDKMIFNMFRAKKNVSFNFDFDKYSEVIDWSINSVNKIENEFVFSPIPNTFYCNNFCEFRGICKYRK